MSPRIDVSKHLNSGMTRALFAMGNETAAKLDHKLFELVKIRASQINGCAYCIDMHTKDARAAGETEQRIYALNAWRETPFFTDRERAALEWTEAVTRVADTHVPDDVFEKVRAVFSEEEIVALTFGVVVINSWNRISVSFRPPVGAYEPQAAVTA
ncbi:MAG TPA: carboxymuconolactone decarboxylase family protein [Vicinamibacterales bacterium]|nr:carboxymuconolactone decarboxylase family protein [Vicinamibacterales bacterium]